MPALNNLNKVLEPVVYLIQNDLSLADLFLFCSLAETVKKWTESETHHFCNISRWYNHIQHHTALCPIIEGSSHSVVFNVDVPKPKGKEEKKQEQQQKTKQGQTAKQPQQPAAAKVEKPIDISRIEFKVGKIIECVRHPDAEFLYKETIDFGEEKPRTVVSGLVKYVPLDQMQNRFVICMTNLKPAPLKGIKSEAMVICSSDVTDPNHKELIDPPAGSVPGDRVFFPDHIGEPDPPINLSATNNIFKTLQVDFKTNEKFEACWKGVVMRTEKGVVTSKTIANGPLS